MNQKSTPRHIFWQNYNPKRYMHLYFITALFTKAKARKNPNVHWQWMDKKDMVHIYNGILLSQKKNEIMPFAATWMELEIIILSEVRKGKTNMIWYHLHVESKIWHKWNYLQNRNSLTDTENRLVVAKAEKGGGYMDWELGIGRWKLLHIEWINYKVLLLSTRNYIQYPEINHNGKEHKKECMYNWITLLYTKWLTQINPTL